MVRAHKIDALHLSTRLQKVLHKRANLLRIYDACGKFLLGGSAPRISDMIHSNYTATTAK